MYVYRSLFNKFESRKYLQSVWFSLNRARLLDIKTFGDLELFSQYTAVFHVIMYLHFYMDYMFQPIYLGHHQVLLVCYFVTLTLQSQ